MKVEITCDGTDYVDYKTLKPFQGDLKTLSNENLEKLKNSIIKYGYSVPGFIWQSGDNKYVLDSHQRIKALDSLFHDGYEIPDIPIVYIQAKDKQEAKEKLLHISSQYGEFTDQGFADFVLDAGIDISELDVRLTNDEFNISEILPENETVGDDDVEDDVEPITKLGDLWELGNHKVLCGDSTDKETVEKLMNGQKADMVFTDPPYGVDYKGIKNDSRDGLANLLNSVFSNYFNFSKRGASIYCFHSDRNADIFHVEFRKYFHFSSMIIWNKNSLTMSQTDYQSKHEPCMYGWMEGGTHLWYSDRKQTSVWDINKESVEGHTTPKPVKIIENAINNSSKSGDIISDYFRGSGSTLIGAEKTGRISKIIELSEHYCDVIVNRYIEWCNKNDREPIVKLNGETYKYSKTMEETT